MTKNDVEFCISKVNEVAQDLRDPQDGSDLEFQAKKLDDVVARLRQGQSRGAVNVHGGGTGED